MYYGNVSLRLSAKEGAAPPNYLRLQKAIHLQLHLKGKTLRIVPIHLFHILSCEFKDNRLPGSKVVKFVKFVYLFTPKTAFKR